MLSTYFGDVVWTGQSTRHIHAAFEHAGLTQDQVREVFMAISPMAYMDMYAAHPKAFACGLRALGPDVPRGILA